MPSDRMMEAIGRMERALSRVERAIDERLAAPATPRINQDEAESALRSLEALIADLKETSDG